MRDNIEKVVQEMFGVSEEDFKKAYIRAINEERNHLLKKVSKHPNYEFKLGKNVKKLGCGEKNKCETNSYAFVKSKLEEGLNNFFPVGGYMFMGKSFFPIEHWWVYNSKIKEHIDVTPLDDLKNVWCYAGVINFDINNEILKSQRVFDVNFFKGGHVYHNYFE